MKYLGYAAAILIGLILFEGLSQALFYTRHGELLARHDRAESLQSANRLDSMEKRVGLPGLRLHPLLGWVSTNSSPGFNAAGFRDSHEYPYAAKPNEFIVGVFGGSVAANFWSYNLAFRKFQIALKALRPELADQTIVLLNFAKEAYRQPQQIAAFNYFTLQGQKFDLVININGYNELTSAWFNLKSGTDIALPSVNLMMEFARLTTADAISASTASRLLAKQLNERAYQQSLASLWLLTLATSKALPLLTMDSTNNAADSFSYIQDENLLFIPTGHVQQDKEVIAEAYTQYQIQSSVLMAAAVQATGASYLEILQPNQYVSTNRKFSESEREIAIFEPTPYDGVIDTAYRALRERSKQPPLSNHFVDASFVLDDIEEHAYADNCCHLTIRGRELLSRDIAKHAAQLLATGSIKAQ